MILHYLKITFRNLWKYKTQSLTGIFGLAFGLACFVPALYWLRYETSYDSFYPDAEQIYRFYTVDKQTGKANELVSGILDRKLHEHFAATENSTVFIITQDNCSSESMPHIRLNTVFADSTFLNVFPQVVICGDARQPLEILNNIILTESVAVRMFGDVENAIGQPIKSTLFDWLPYTVTAVVKDPPPNTNVPFDAILYHETFAFQKNFVARSVEHTWVLATLQGYMRFHPHTDIDGLSAQLLDFPARLDANANLELRILPVSDIRYKLNTDVRFTLNFIRLFVAAGILLILCALFNFLSLHLSLFHQRISELRQRTVHGAKSRQLTIQMMFELSCSILLSLLVAFFVIILIRPVCSGLLGITMQMSQLIYLFFICGTGVIALMLLVSFMPFWRLTRLAMQNLSKRKIQGKPISQRMAVSFQLAVSVVFIVVASVVMMQMRFINRKDLGFDQNRIIQLSGLSFYTNRDALSILKNELASIPQIESITETYFEPQHNMIAFNNENQIMSATTEVEWPRKLQSENPFFQTIPTDSRFAETFGLKILTGEWYDDVGGHKIVLNEEAVRVMALNEPVGAIIHIKDQEFKVVGVVKDFHTLSLRSRIYPTIFFQNKDELPGLYVRVVPGQEQAAIQRINAILPEIDASFVDIHPTPLVELYNRLNRSEQAGLKMFSVLAAVCLLISLFGIYAVATASTQRRRKEIAIRKVFGAQVSDIVGMFFREYTMQVIMACIVALPLAYYAMHRWLEGYAYRTNIPWWLLASVITVIATVVLLTVLGQVLKAANSNPAEVVKSE